MCNTCNNGLAIPEAETLHEDEHGKFRVCPDCGGSANVTDEPFKE